MQVRTKLKSPTIKLRIESEVPGWWFFCRSPTSAPQAMP